MKKISFALLLALAFFDSDAQPWYNTVTNYHMCDVAPAKDQGCPTFTGIPNNWERSHGTPNFHPSYIWMYSSNAGEGEGIFQNSVFPATSTYKVKIGIQRYKKEGDSKILVLATSGITATGTKECGTAPPNAAPNSVVVGVYDGPSVTNYEWTVNASFYNTFPNEHQILIYPELFTSTGGQTELEVDYVIVCDIGSTTYSCGYVPNSINYAPSYQIGSSFPNGCGGVVGNYWGSYTELRAGNFIDIEPNTLISATSGGYFVGTIDPSVKCQTENRWGWQCGGASKQNTLNVANSSQTSSFSIYPNPTSSSFTITFPSADNYLVKITDMLGTTVYSNTFENTQKQEINTDNLPSGTYTIQVAGSNNSFVQKLVITK